MKNRTVVAALGLVSLVALSAPGAGQGLRSGITYGSVSSVHEKFAAAASHDFYERGELVSDLDYLGSSGRAYEVTAVAAAGSMPFAACSLDVGWGTGRYHFSKYSSHAIQPALTARLFPTDVTKSYWLTTGSYTLSGNVTGTASMDLTFTAPSASTGRWLIHGWMAGSAQGTMRLVAAPLGGMLEFAGDFSDQDFFGDFENYTRGAVGLTYRRRPIDARLRLAPLTLFGTPRYTTLVSVQVIAENTWPFLWFF